ncbi:MAG: hypothetical protein HKN61_00515 [Flavobacteriaceae bacterium]|nr:hypothetical protein [Flavobacteriaceae bacterium]
MKLRKTWFCWLLISLFMVSSCDISDDRANFHFISLNILEAELPESFNLNETYEIKVTYLRPNGCSIFEGFDIRKDDLTTRTVVAVGSEFEDQGCTQATEEVQTFFNFICLYDETYTFRFYAGEEEDGTPIFLEYEVPVNQQTGNNQK